MKKIIFILATAFALLLFSCSNASDSGVDSKVDWLFLCYFDADSNLNDSLYVNIRSAELGLAYARNPDGSPAQGYPSIAFVVLWDGISEELKGGSMFMHPDGAVFELGPDYELKALVEEAAKEGKPVDIGSEWKLGANTKDVTYAASSWLPKEPDMGGYETLEGFLKWAKSRYSAKNVVVNLNDHGAGPHKETYDYVTKVSGSLCSDTTNAKMTKKQRLLTCKNIKDALRNAGYTGADKPKILWNDVCLQASAEVVYNFAGCAEYLSASPNASISNEYTNIISNIKSSCAALDVGKLITSVYYGRCKDYTQSHFTTDKDSKENRSSGCSMYTWSLISLDKTKAELLKIAVDNFAGALLGLKAVNKSAFDSVYTKYVRQDIDCLANCKGLAYCGTFAFLNDIGYLVKEIKADPALSVYAELQNAATALQNLLKHGDNNLIVYAWGSKRARSDTADCQWSDITPNQMYLTGQKDFLSGEQVDVENPDDIYGLTIVGSKRVLTDKQVPKEGNAVLNYYNWTGFSANWHRVINAWMESGL
ncbi:MAG: hypothetical protein IK094_03685 [Treponema sp.]|nr:hypothetical protein [Treponema sp.]